MLLSQRIKTDGITITTDQLGGMSDDGHRYRWAVTLHRPDGRTFSLPDPFEFNDEPTAFDVLDLIVGACNVIDRSESWRDWQSEYAIANSPEEQEERDRTHPYAMYRQWMEINRRLADFLGEPHGDYLYDTDRNH